MEKGKGFNRILLATDGSSQAEAAADVTIDLARFSTATVRVLHVWNLEVHHKHGLWDIEMRNEAEDLVQRMVDRLSSAGLEAEKEIFRADSGHIAEAIALVAKEFHADLVVVGSRGLSDWQSMFQHSVSHQVLCKVDCPVLIARAPVKAGLAESRRIVLAIAGGDDLGPIVKAAVAAAGVPGSSVMVVHVTQAVLGAQGFAYVEQDEEIKETMAKALRLLGDAEIKAEGMVAHAGPVAKVVAEVAERWNANLIVTGSSRMSDLASLLLGSASHSLLHGTELPVIVAERISQ